MTPPLVVTAAIIYENDKILLIKRSREPFQGFWSFVGGCGAFEYYADPAQAVQREVKSDLDCEFEPAFLTYNYEDFFGKPSVVLYFIGKINGNPTIDPKYVSEYRWFSVEEAQDLELGFDQKKILINNVLPYIYKNSQS